MTPYQALVAVFNQEHPDPPTSEEAARLMLRLLHAEGFAVVPVEATGVMAQAWRKAGCGANPKGTWRVMVRAAIDG